MDGWIGCGQWTVVKGSEWVAGLDPKDEDLAGWKRRDETRRDETRLRREG